MAAPDPKPVVHDRQIERLVAPVAAIPLSESRIDPAVGSGHEVLPLSQRGRASGPVGLAVGEVAIEVEVIVDVGVNRSELL